MTAGNITTGGSVSAATVSASGDVQGANLSTAGAVSSATLSVSGNAVVGNLSTAGVITATGNITSNANVITDNILGRTGGVTITAISTNQSITLVPTGTGSVSVSSKKITSLATPTDDTDAATKAYVDSVAQGLNIKASVYAATYAALPSYTYNNGTAGVGATITANANGALVVDGQTISTVGTRVLVKNETAGNAPYNGIYTLTTAGDVSTAFVLTRSLDMNVPAEFDGAFTFISTGTQNADTGWVQTSEVVTVGTTPVVWTQFSGAGQYTANTSAGLILNGTVFSAKVDANANPTIGFDSNGNLYVPSNARFTTPNVGAATGTSLSVTGNVTAANFFGPLSNGSSNVTVLTNGNINLTADGNTSLVVTSTGANVVGALGVTGNVTAANFIGNVVGNISGNITIPGANTQVVYVDANGYANSSAAFTFNSGSNLVTVSSVLAVTANTKITGATVTTSSTNSTVIATFPVAGVTGVEYLVKGIAAGTAYSMATVQAITDGGNVDYATYATLALGAATFTDLAVVVSGSNIELTVNAASSSSTVWTTQYRLI
jgi:hypothetical protein